jgi:hypothetical protein
MKRGIFYKASLVLVPFLVSVILRLWFATCRITEHGSGNLETALDSKKSVIALFWHYSLVYVFYHLKKYPAAVLVSASEDGEYIEFFDGARFEQPPGASGLEGVDAQTRTGGACRYGCRRLPGSAIHSAGRLHSARFENRGADCADGLVGLAIFYVQILGPDLHPDAVFAD